MNRRFFWISLTIGALGLATLLLNPLDWRVEISRGGQPVAAAFSIGSGAASAQSASEGIEALRSQSRAFVQISRTVLPGVVSITSERSIRVSGMPAPDGFRFFGDEFFGRFFQAPRDIPQVGSGSGVIVSRNGYILTNNHVVADADDIQVMLHDGRSFKGEIVGRDPKSDVAVIRIDAPDLHPVEMGDSDALEVGELVMAFGNPFRLSSTVTAGIVSATGRSRIGVADYEDFIQTDAAINPGNSGGPLVNLDGRIIGINTAIATRSGGYQGIGFAIPINMAQRIMDSLIRTGRVVRGWLGVNIQNLTPEMAEIFELDRPRGALVGRVVENSPAEDAGLMQGDVILELDGQQIAGVEDLQLRVTAYDPGSGVDIVVLRDGRRERLRATLGELDGDLAAAGLEKEETARTRNLAQDLGLAVEELTARIRRQIDLPPSVDGVVVADVDRTRPAGRAGIRAGDVILEVAGEKVLSAPSLERALDSVDRGRPALFLIWRDGSEIFLAVRVPE